MGSYKNKVTSGDIPRKLKSDRLGIEVETVITTQSVIQQNNQHAGHVL